MLRFGLGGFVWGLVGQFVGQMDATLETRGFDDDRVLLRMFTI